MCLVLTASVSTQPGPGFTYAAARAQLIPVQLLHGTNADLGKNRRETIKTKFKV